MSSWFMDARRRVLTVAALIVLLCSGSASTTNNSVPLATAGCATATTGCVAGLVKNVLNTVATQRRQGRAGYIASVHV